MPENLERGEPMNFFEECLRSIFGPGIYYVGILLRILM